jgi:hypothetical protein
VGNSQLCDSAAMDVDPSPRAATQQESSQGSSTRLVRASQLQPFVLEQFLESTTQCADDLLEEAIGMGAWPASVTVVKQTKVHQKMAFHVAVYLKVWFTQ